MLKDFSKIEFKGTFRSYQQKVLNDMNKYLNDNKIHIVASPGSGKTTLGIELIKRLNEPALILSPSITIRNQWGKRIRDGFLCEEEDIHGYVSYSLKDTKLFTSITYQSLHAAFHHLIDKDETDNEMEDELYTVDYTNFELLEEVKKRGIKTICLDEAHHLRSEWYKALSAFLTHFKQEFKIIALTATPPYDSNPTEWEHYVSLCGEIDEEIFVPELVEQKNLCPHQDYIYFNYPTTKELNDVKEYHQKVLTAEEDIFCSPLLLDFTRLLYEDYLNPKYEIFEHAKAYYTLMLMISNDEVKRPKRLQRLLSKTFPAYKLNHQIIEELVKFMIERADIFSKEIVDFIYHTLKEHGVLERGKPVFTLSQSLKRSMISSIGKIASIGDIARFESQTLGHDLQMLVLTDYIKKELIHQIGSSDELLTFGAVPIFEVIRRNISSDIKLAMLTGSLVIIPKSIEPLLDKQASLHHTTVSYDSITDEFSVVKIKGTVKDSVSMITNLFENRDIDILVGTKSLLGEGWDSPCINTLIMASFVGSYMLSNQMRGRAIRTDRNDPDKVSSIWHLATIEPFNAVKLHWYDSNKMITEYEKDEIVSEDFEMLKRRFNTFLGPTYSTGEISSGIERIDIIEPPYSNLRFQSFNQKTLQIASNRNHVREMWDNALTQNMTKEIIDASEVKKEFYPTGVIIYDIVPNSVAAAVLSRFLAENIGNNGYNLLSLILIVIIFFILVKPFKRLLWNNSPKRTIEGIATAIFRTMKKLALVESHSAVVHVKKNPLTSGYYAYLEHATHHEKTLFSNSMSEVFTSIGSAKYIIVSYRNFFGVPLYFYESSYAVPSIFSVNKDRAEEYASYLEEYIGRVELVFTRSESGLSKLLKAQKKSKVNRYNLSVFSKKMLKTDFPKKK